MTKLKTLKDIEKEREELHKECFECCEDYEPIKQEAIKWIKAEPDDIFFRECRIRDWIKHFFNIEEADLSANKNE